LLYAVCSDADRGSVVSSVFIIVTPQGFLDVASVPASMRGHSCYTTLRA
jgi:hypothetical protein